MRVLLIGCGHMGQALLRCLDMNDRVLSVDILDPAYDNNSYNIFRKIDDISEKYDVVILAIKPQTYPEIRLNLAQLLDKYGEGIVLSMMACISAADLHADFEGYQIVRCMPNVAVAYQKGLTTLYGVTPVERSEIEKILDHTGKLLWVDTEEQLDVLTIFNGCGPGLLLAITAAFSKVCQDQGFEPNEADGIMRQVFIGTAALLEHKPNPLSELIASIATKGWVTEACLHALTPSLETAFQKSVTEGLKRMGVA